MKNNTYNLSEAEVRASIANAFINWVMLLAAMTLTFLLGVGALTIMT